VAVSAACNGAICDRLPSGVVLPMPRVDNDDGVNAPLLATRGVVVDPLVPAAVAAALSSTVETEVVGFTGEEFAVASFAWCAFELVAARDTAVAAAAIPITPTDLTRMRFAGLVGFAVSRLPVRTRACRAPDRGRAASLRMTPMVSVGASTALPGVVPDTAADDRVVADAQAAPPPSTAESNAAPNSRANRESASLSSAIRARQSSQASTCRTTRRLSCAEAVPRTIHGISSQ
jgi:hypothetical protein